MGKNTSGNTILFLMFLPLVFVSIYIVFLYGLHLPTKERYITFSNCANLNSTHGIVETQCSYIVFETNTFKFDSGIDTCFYDKYTSQITMFPTTWQPLITIMGTVATVILIICSLFILDIVYFHKKHIVKNSSAQRVF